MGYDLNAFIDLMGLKLLPYQKRILEYAVANREIYITPVSNKSRLFAEWWTNECGGMFCSNCGHFHDDYFEHPPIICKALL